MVGSSKPSWRKGRSDAGGGSGDAGKGWQSRRVPPTKSAASSHRSKLIGLGLVAIALVAYFVVTVFFIPVKTPLLIVTAIDYPSPLPPNGFAQEDAAKLAIANSENIQALEPLTGKLTRESFLRFLDDRLPARGGGPNKDVILLYVSAHGVVNDAAEPCLLLSDSSPLDAKSWLKFSEIVARMKDRPKVKVVLLLDGGRIDDDWSLGILTNGFAEQLEAYLIESAVPNLYVLNAASANERAWTAPEMGGSVFGHFAAQGLNDAASPNDKVITLRELADYLSSQVAAWVRQNRASRQSPKLLPPLPPSADFAIAYRGLASARGRSAGNADGQQDAVRRGREQLAADWKSVLESWRQLEQHFQDRRLIHYEPLAAARWQRLLLRMENLLLSGSAYRGEFAAAQTKVRTFAETDPQAALLTDFTTYSFPLQSHLAPAVGRASVRPTAETVLARWIADQGQPKLKEGDPPLPQLDYASAADVAWRFLRQLPSPSRISLREALALMDTTPGRQNAKGDRIPEVGEVLFLRMVAQYVDRPETTTDFSEGTRRYLREVLELRELAEQAAVPRDDRATLWIQPLVDAADSRRRVAEDELFTDRVSAASEEQVQQLFASNFAFRSQYEAAVERAERIGQAYALRDEIDLNLPPLAAWLLRAETRTRQQVIGTDAALTSVAQLLQQVAADHHELAAAMDKLLTDNQLDAPNLQTAFEKVRGEWTKLRDPFVAHCQELKDRAGQDKPTLREIAEVLRVPAPLLAAEERERLVRKYQNILFSDAAPPVDTGIGIKLPSPESRSPAGKSSEQDSEYALLQQHPALDVLARNRLSLLLNLRSPTGDVAPKDEGTPQRYARQGAQVRRWLSDLGLAARDLEDVTNRRLEEATETAANLRAGISEADRLVRAAASLVSTDLRDPAQRLRRVDLHLAMLWQTRRVLDDFWGPPPGSSPERESYFVTVAESYLNAARRLEDTPKSLVYQRVDLSQLLAERRSAIAGTKVEPQDLRTIGDTPTVRQQVHVAWPRGVPSPGFAAMFLEGTVRNSQTELIPVRDPDVKPWRRQLVPVGPMQEVEIKQLVPAQQLTAAKADLNVTANVLFRGHLIRSPFAIRSPDSILSVAVDPRLPRRAKVTVKGEGNRRAFIVFIFDCSRSMEQDGRIAKAKEGFRRVLDSLPRDEHYQVGLRAYGRRAGYNSDGTRVYGPDGQDTDRDPNTDVELMVEVGPLTEQHHAAISQRFRDLQPLGVTPLYLAIKDALQSDDFVLARPDDLRHLIVITDGINEQRGKVTTADDVLRTIRNDRKADGVRMDVVLFQEAALLNDPKLLQRIGGPNQLAKELEDIKRVAAAAGGDFFSAENPEQLVEVLRRALKLVRYSVTAVGASPSQEADRIDLEQDWTVMDLPAEPQKYVVQLHGASRPAEQAIVIEGGEALELEYDKSEDLLVFPTYKRGDAREPLDELVDSVTNERYRVLPILPRKNLQRVEFAIAVQNRDRRKFTSRPRHVWAEVQPLNDADQAIGPAYQFYDPLFVPGTPVPVLQFVVSNWPAGATKGALRAWLKFDFPPLKPNGTALVEELKSVVVEEDIPQVSFQAEIKQIGAGQTGWRVTVTEEHEPGTELFTARVQSSPTPNLLRHQFFVGVDIVRHEFEYTERPAPTVSVTARERITQNAVIVPRVVMEVKN